MAIIPASLQPKTMVAGAVTVSQQRDIKQYGSLQAASQARFDVATQKFEDKRSGQINSLKLEIERAKNEIRRNSYTQGRSKQYRRRAQANTKGANARLTELNKALKGIGESGAYDKVDTIISNIKSYSRDVKDAETDRMASKVSKTKRAPLPKGAYSRGDRDKTIVYNKEGDIIRVTAKTKAGARQVETLLSKQQKIIQTSPVATQVIQGPITQQKSLKIRPGQGVYLDVGDVKVSRPSAKGQPSIWNLKQGAQVYTSPDKTGPTLKPEDIRFVDSSKQYRSPQIKKPVYIPIQDLGPVTPGKQPIVLSPELKRQLDLTQGNKFRTPNQDKSLFIQNTYPIGAGGTATFTVPTQEERKQLDKFNEFDTFTGTARYAGGKVKQGALLYKRGVEILSEKGIKIGDTQIIAPLGGIGGAPARKFVSVIVIPSVSIIKKGLIIYQENVVKPISESGIPVGTKNSPARFLYGKLTGGETRTAPLGFQQESGRSNNPMAQIAEAKRKIDEIAKTQGPGATVTINLQGKDTQVLASEYSKLGLIAFMEKVYGQQVEASWKQAAKDYSREILRNEVSEKVASNIGKGARITQEFAPYAILGFFETKVIAKAGEAQAFGGAFGGPTSALGYAVENPVEVAVASVLIYAKFVGKASKTWSKTDAAKYKKYLTDRKIEVDNIKRVMKTKQISSTRYRPTSGQQIGPGQYGFKEVGLKAKGGTSSTYNIPTNTFKGNAKELVQVGSKEILLKSKLKVLVSESGKVTRTFTYVDGTVKVITTKGSKITTELFSKSGRTLFSKTKDIPGYVDKMIAQKVPTTKVTASADNFTQYTVKVSKARGVNKDLIQMTNDITGEVRTVGSNTKIGKEILKKQKEGLWSGKIRIKTGTDIARSVTKNQLRGQVVRTDKSLGDLIVASDKKVEAVVQLGKQKGRLDVSIGQRIEFGIDKSKDALIKVAKKGKAIKLSVTSPDVGRAIQQKTSQRIVSYQISPKFKGGERYANLFSKGKPITKATGGPNVISIDWQPFNQPTIKETAKSAAAKAKAAAAKAKAAAAKAKEFASRSTESARNFGLKTKQLLKKSGASPEQISSFQSAYSYQPGVTYVQPAQTYIPTGPLTLSAPGVGPTVRFVERSATLLAVGSLFAAATISATKTDAKQELKLKQDPRIDIRVINQPDIKIDTIIGQDIRIDTKTKQTPDTISTPSPGPGPGHSPGPTPIPSPTPTPTLTGLGIPPIIVDLDFGRKPVDELVKAYRGEILTKSGYQKVTEEPSTKKGARDVIARILDNTTSATGRTVPLKKKVNESTLKKGDGYYQQNRKKFRGFKIVKGNTVPLKNTIIERRGFRSDTPGEKKGLTVGQFQARSSKRARGLPTRKASKRKSPFRL